MPDQVSGCCCDWIRKNRAQKEAATKKKKKIAEDGRPPLGGNSTKLDSHELINWTVYADAERRDF